VFRTYLNKRKNWKTGKEEVAMTFSPTELKNYPVQGFSTGDVVPIVLGKLYRWWISLDNSIRSQIKPVVTVHDSVVFDVAPDAVEFAKNNIPPIMVNVKKHLEDLDITDWDVTIKVGISEGSNWFECTEVGSFSS
jgi:DNA polymerase I-like protein with 3'-5' exonuclease and polymerase domains